MTVTSDYALVPDYLNFTKEERRKWCIRFSIFPLLCLAFILLLIIGEFFPNVIPSFSKLEYYLKANEIANEIANGNIEEIVGHTRLYYEENEINYIISNNELNTLYDDIKTAFKNAYVESASEGKPSVYIGNLCYKEKNTPDGIKTGCWTAVGIIEDANRETIANFTVTFSSLTNYCVGFLSCANNNWQASTDSLEWYQSILSGGHNIPLNVVLTSNNISKGMIYSTLMPFFTSSAFEYKEDAQYKEELARRLYELTQKYDVINASISWIDYDEELHGIQAVLNISIKDGDNHGHISVDCIYGPYGYEIIGEERITFE